MFGLLACSEAYEFGQLGILLPDSVNILFQRRFSSFLKKEPTASMRGDPELQRES